MSSSDESELDYWRSKSPGCHLPDNKVQQPRSMQEALDALPALMRMILRVKLRAAGWAGPLGLTREEVSDIGAAHKLMPREIMILLLDVAAAFSAMGDESEHIGAVVQGATGNLYMGSSYEWGTKGIKISAHAAQAAILSAWHHGEKSVKSLMLEAVPCSCCRQFLRELHNWDALEIFYVPSGAKAIGDASISQIPLALEGLRLEDIKQSWMNQRPRRLAIAQSDDNMMINIAAEAASNSYAPYSNNSAGVAIRANNGLIYSGRNLEMRESIVGFLAVESAILNLYMSGNKLESIEDILLVETRGTVTQFSATQKLATALGNIPFRFTMTS